MDQLKNFYSQLKDMFLGMTPGNRLTVALLLAGLFVSLAFLVIKLPQSEGKYVPAYGGRFFDQSKQIAIGDALAKANLSDYDWKEGKLIVPKKELTRYVAAIAEANIIVEHGGYLLQAVNSLGAYETGKMMDEKMRQHKQVEIASVLRNFSWIRDAAVISSPRSERDYKLYDKKIVNSVTVTIWPHKEEELNDERRCAITATVKTAFSVTDLKEITIVDGNNGDSYYGSDEKTRGGTKTYEDTMEYHQKLWNKRIKELFADISGLRVETTVTLDPTLWRKAHDVNHGKPTAVATRERNTDLEKTGPDIAGRPGMVPQNGLPLPNPQMQVVQGSRTKETTEENERNMALQGVEGTSQLAGLTPQAITASLRVPISHIKKVWAERNTKPGEPMPEPTDTDLQTLQTELFTDIRQSVAKLMESLRPADAVDTTQMISVTPYSDSKVIETEPTFAQMLMAWFGTNWETLSLLGLVLVGMVVLWNMTRVRQPEPIVIYEAAELPQEEVPLTDEEIAAMEEEEGVKRSLEPFSKSIISLQNEVAELVNENPDAAASVLRQWIGNVTFQE